MAAAAPRLFIRSLPLRRLASRTAVPTATKSTVPVFAQQRHPFHSSQPTMASFDKPVASVDAAHLPDLPGHSPVLFDAKKAKQLSFEQLGKELGRDEVAVAALFYGQAKPSEQDVVKLSQILDIDNSVLQKLMYGWPDRGRSVPMPPREPLIYRLYEIVQNYGYAYKAVLNEKFGDGIMSAISFSTNVKKETDDKGDWVVITLRGKWLPFTRF